MRNALYGLILSAIISTWILCVTSDKLYLYQNLWVEIDYCDGCYPAQESLAWFKNKIDSIGICKKEHIFIKKDSYLGWKPFKPDIQLGHLYYIEDHFRDCSESLHPDFLDVYVQCLPGFYEMPGEEYEGTKIIGLTYTYSSIALFYPLVRHEENYVMVHELLHVILENEGDLDQHCSNPNCLMAPIMTENNYNLDTKCQNKLNKMILKRYR